MWKGYGGYGRDIEDMEICGGHGQGDGDYGGLSDDVVKCGVRGYISLFKKITN